MISPATPIIGCDMDNVLADYRTPHDQMVADGKTPFTEIKDDPYFWTTLDPYRGVTDWLTRLKAHPEATYFITTRYGCFPQDQTGIWLSEHGYEHASVIISAENKDKARIAHALGVNAMIDDNPAVFRSFARLHGACCFFLIDQPWNQDVKMQKKHTQMRVRDVGEALDRLGV